MKKENKERILAGLIFIGGLIVFGAVGGMETNIVGLIDGTLILLVGFVILFGVIFWCNRSSDYTG